MCESSSVAQAMHARQRERWLYTALTAGRTGGEYEQLGVVKKVAVRPTYEPGDRRRLERTRELRGRAVRKVIGRPSAESIRGIALR